MSSNCHRRQHQHRIISFLLSIILAPIHTYSISLAFVVGSCQKCNGKPLNLLGLRRHTFRDGFQFSCNRNGALLWCNVAFAAPIAISPSNSIPSIQKTYSTSDFASSGAISALETKPSSSIADLGLKPPTDTKPQIKLKGRMDDDRSLKYNRVPILQGLVYFPELAPKDSTDKGHEGKKLTQQLDFFNDVLILTAASSSQPHGPLLAGAKMPISSLRFPFSFQMYEENLLVDRPGVRAAWEKAVTSEDIILRATICPSDSPSFPCDDENEKKHAEGVAKLITQLPGLTDGDQIRAPASLPLQ